MVSPSPSAFANSTSLPAWLAALRDEYPFEPKQCSRPAGSLRFVDEGPSHDTCPILMVHGNPTWSFFYRNLIKRLRPTRRCLAPDHLGCGLSDRPKPGTYGYTLAERIVDLDALVRSVHGDGQVDLVVHDWGGMIGLAWALQNWGRVRRFVVFNTAAFPLPAEKKLPLSLKLARTPVLGALLVRGLNGFCLGAARYCSMKGLSAPARRGFLAPYGTWSDRKAVHRFVQDIPLTPAEPSYAIVNEAAEQLGRLRETPVLVCWGGKDFVFDDHFYREWQRRVPGGQYHYFPDAGHYLLEDTGEVILRKVESFLTNID